MTTTTVRISFHQITICLLVLAVLFSILGAALPKWYWGFGSDGNLFSGHGSTASAFQAFLIIGIAGVCFALILEILMIISDSFKGNRAIQILTLICVLIGGNYSRWFDLTALRADENNNNSHVVNIERTNFQLIEFVRLHVKGKYKEEVDKIKNLKEVKEIEVRISNPSNKGWHKCEEEDNQYNYKEFRCKYINPKFVELIIAEVVKQYFTTLTVYFFMQLLYQPSLQMENNYVSSIYVTRADHCSLPDTLSLRWKHVNFNEIITVFPNQNSLNLSVIAAESGNYFYEVILKPKGKVIFTSYQTEPIYVSCDAYHGFTLTDQFFDNNINVLGEDGNKFQLIEFVRLYVKDKYKKEAVKIKNLKEVKEIEVRISDDLKEGWQKCTEKHNQNNYKEFYCKSIPINAKFVGFKMAKVVNEYFSFKIYYFVQLNHPSLQSENNYVSSIRVKSADKCHLPDTFSLQWIHVNFNGTITVVPNQNSPILNLSLITTESGYFFYEVKKWNNETLDAKVIFKSDQTESINVSSTTTEIPSTSEFKKLSNIIISSTTTTSEIPSTTSEIPTTTTTSEIPSTTSEIPSTITTPEIPSTTTTSEIPSTNSEIPSTNSEIPSTSESKKLTNIIISSATTETSITTIASEIPSTTYEYSSTPAITEIPSTIRTSEIPSNCEVKILF